MQLQVKSKQVPIFYGVILIILVLGFGLRLLRLEQYPTGVNQDELSNIYDGYAIAETGADRWGLHFPVILRGFGRLDYRPPMYAWLSAATIQVFGFSVFAGRLVSAVLGCGSLVLGYLVARRLGGRLFAYFALLLAALSPWHIIFSRTASEGTMLPPFFLIGACYLWQRAKEADYKPLSLVLLGLCIGLGTNTYQAGKLLFFLFAGLVVVDIWVSRRQVYARAALFGAACLVGVIPQLIALATMPSQFFSRASGTTEKFSPTFSFFSSLLRKIYSYFSADFLFFDFENPNNLSISRLLTTECLAFYFGLFFLYKVLSKKQVLKPAYIYFLLFITVLPGALTPESPHALRAAGLVVLLPFITAAGIIFLYRHISRRWLQAVFLVVATFMIAWNALFFSKRYVRSEELRGTNMQVVLVEATKKLNTYKGRFEHFYIDNEGNEPYIYVLAFCEIKPQDFQKMHKKIRYAEWDDFKQMGPYYFVNRAAIAESLRNESAKSLILLREKNPHYQVIDSVRYLDEKMYFYSYN
ncbi:MAG: hypothetical protein EOO56_18475 [Hymenobacter sp.]|nr:MAG: hypothetical protein EOO56_18475 [Hymenobacter sp.]